MNREEFERQLFGSGAFSMPMADEPKKKKKGGFLSNLLPVVGGTIGAIAGAPFAPLTGGASILAGGALGSGLGEFGRQKVTGEDLNLGTIGREVAFGALPGVGRLAKGATKVIKGSKAITSPSVNASQILNTSTVQKPSTGMQAVSERLFGRQTGITPDAKVGSSVLDAPGMPKASDLREHIRTKIGSRSIDSAATISEKNRAFISDRSQVLDQILSGSDLPVGKTATRDILTKMKKPVGVDLTTSQVYKDVIQDMPKITNIKELNNFKRELDDIINYGRPGVDPKEERIARAIRRSINDYIGDKVPETKPINKELSTAYDVQKFIQPASAKPTGQARPFGIPIPGSARAQQSLSGLASGILDGSKKIASVAPGQAGVSQPLSVGRAAVGQLSSRLGGSALLGTPFAGQAEQPEDQGVGSSQTLSINPMSGNDILSEQAPSLEQQQYERFRLGAMRAASVGDTEAAKELMAMAEMFVPAKESKNVQEQAGKVESARTIVDNLMNVYQQVGSAKGVYRGTAADVLGRLNIGEGNELARAYQENRMSYLTPIVKAFGEVGVLTDKDREVIANAIPSITDTPAQAEQKMNLLYTMLDSLSNSGMTGTEEMDIGTAQTILGQVR